jgi:HAD superfamily hydrolase (TIGR01509 family)
MIPIPFVVRAVLFDFDGTLTLPGALNFGAFKGEIGCPADMPVLEFLETLPTGGQREAAANALERFEMAAAARSVPNPEAEQIVRELRSRGLKVGIVTRNCARSVARALENFNGIGGGDFDLIVSRDCPVRPKPSADGILLAARTLGVASQEILMVGDYVFDVEAGQQAGAVTVFLDNREHPAALRLQSDFTISSLGELRPILGMGRVLPCGKLPNALLRAFFAQLPFADPAMIVKPGVGEDTAAVDVSVEEVLVLKSDPITFATDAIGQYAVLVNANDIATSGAVPRWLLTTLLFPRGVTGAEIWQVMNELRATCQRWGITLCGGHTEITDAVTRPVVIGMLAGTVGRAGLVDKRNMACGDHVLITKGVAVEGTAIIAREFGRRLAALGVSGDEIEACRQFLDRISIITEARIAADTPGVSAMHDVTEGGLAAALKELGEAGGHRIRVDMDRIPIFPETRKLTGLLGLDPLGLIGSGSLLITCAAAAADTLAAAIRSAGVAVAVIGEVLAAGEGIEALCGGRSVPWPCFEVDEITRLF